MQFLLQWSVYKSEAERKKRAPVSVKWGRRKIQERFRVEPKTYVLWSGQNWTVRMKRQRKQWEKYSKQMPSWSTDFSRRKEHGACKRPLEKWGKVVTHEFIFFMCSIETEIDHHDLISFSFSGGLRTSQPSLHPCCSLPVVFGCGFMLRTWSQLTYFKLRDAVAPTKKTMGPNVSSLRQMRFCHGGQKGLSGDQRKKRSLSYLMEPLHRGNGVPALLSEQNVRGEWLPTGLPNLQVSSVISLKELSVLAIHVFS